MSKLESLAALEILDSRGRPTVLAECRLASGASGRAAAPSGASTGAAEALETRDGDARRYAGLGCQRAVANIEGEIQRALRGMRLESQAELDRRLIELDGKPDKSRLGANAIVAVSLAFCRAQAAERDLPLFAHLAQLAGSSPRLPRPMINLFSGGAHAGGQVAVQDVQLVVLAADSIADTLALVSEVFRAAAKTMKRRYGMRLLTADEGGLAPPFPASQAMLDAAVEAIKAAGCRPGIDIALALDVAASQFYQDDLYQLDGEALERDAMLERLIEWTRDYPIISLEDGLREDDWNGWAMLRERLAGRVMVLGDDLLCANPTRIQRAIVAKAADSLLLKVNQIGTVTEALAAMRLARAAGWKVVVSARSGETEDDWLADLAAGWAGDYIKVGSITQSERLAKYNRLLYLERFAGLRLRD